MEKEIEVIFCSHPDGGGRMMWNSLSQKEKEDYIRSLPFSENRMFNRGLELGGRKFAEILARTFIPGMENVEIKDVRVQHYMANPLGGKDTVYDSFAKTGDGRYIIYEMQLRSDPHFSQRLRYESSSFAMRFVHKGDGYDALPDLVLLIMEGYDRFRDGKAIHRARWMSEEGYVVDQSECRVYVTLTHKGDDSIGRLIHDLTESEPEMIYNEYIRKTMERIKNSEKEVSSMIISADYIFQQGQESGLEKGMEKGAENARRERDIEVASVLLKEGRPPEEIESTFKISRENIKEAEKLLSRTAD